MLSLSPTTHIDVHVPPTDMRQSFDGLTGLVRSVFKAESLAGSWFLFAEIVVSPHSCLYRSVLGVEYFGHRCIIRMCDKRRYHARRSTLATR